MSFFALETAGITRCSGRMSVKPKFMTTLFVFVLDALASDDDEVVFESALGSSQRLSKNPTIEITITPPAPSKSQALFSFSHCIHENAYQNVNGIAINDSFG